MCSAAYLTRMAVKSTGLKNGVAGTKPQPSVLSLAASYSSMSSVANASNRFGWPWWHHRPPRSTSATPIYQLTDRLHDGHTACVRADEIAMTISAWLAELGVHSPLAEDLAHAVRTGDWPAAHAIGEHLSVDVTVAP